MDTLQFTGCEKIYSDRTSGAKVERSGLCLALEVSSTDWLRFAGMAARLLGKIAQGSH